MSLEWVSVGDPFHGGQSFGDIQVSDDWSVRFAPKKQPDDGVFALIDVDVCVCEVEHDTSTCIHCDTSITRDDNGTGDVVWVHDFGSTVCYDDPPGSIEEGDTTTVAEPEARYYVEDRTTLTICTDADDPGGTEVWTDTVYGDGSALFYSTIEEADKEAQRWANDYIANVSDYMFWDGRTRTV